MKLKHKRLTFVFISIGLFSIAVILILNAFEENIVFFYSPSDLNDKKIARDQKVRIGGLVEKGSVKRLDDGNISFTITDLKSSIDVKFKGILPDLFREEQVVVAEGLIKHDTFFAQEVLAKHDEKYMPPNVAESLKKAGQWQGSSK